MTPQYGDGDRPTIFRVGDVLNNTYRIEAVLGRGGMSEVYRARTEVAGHLVAIKALRPEHAANAAFVKLMTREEDIREIRHDAIVRYFHNQRTESGIVFLVMDYVDGIGLDRRMKQGGLPAQDLLLLAERVAGGLAVAHEKVVVHRDLSPDNIILRNGKPDEAVIIDFGIAKLNNPEAETVIGTDFAGKYAYAAPEQLTGQADHSSDIYAFGAVLLAAFRGRSPKLGSNLLEIAEMKNRPLDTEGVPEPLRTLIDRMTEPDRARRIRNGAALVAAVREARSGRLAPVERHADETVIAPLAAARPALRTEEGRRTGPVAPAPPHYREAPGFRGRILTAAAILLVLGGAGAGGAWYAGLLPFGGPAVDPYVLVVERTADDAGPHAVGHVPTEQVRHALAERMNAAGGSAEIVVGRGAIAPGWGNGMLALVDAASELDEWRVAALGDAVRVSGMTEDRALRDRLTASLPEEARGAGLAGEVDIDLGPRILAKGRLEPILAAHADCGPLDVANPPASSFLQGATVRITGAVSHATTREAVTEAIERIAGERQVVVDVETLGAMGCVERALAQAPARGFDTAFWEGATGRRVEDGRFVIGENPVIDVTIPADVTDGYLHVVALDVSGKVFHLLPNAFREDNSVESLRAGESGEVRVRLAHSLAERDEAEGRRLAFLVGDEALGDTKIVVIHTEEPILGGARPTESAASFLDLLGEDAGRSISSVDTRLLRTARAWQ